MCTQTEKLINKFAATNLNTYSFTVMHGITLNDKEHCNESFDEYQAQPGLSRQTGIIYYSGGFLAANQYDLDDCLEFTFDSPEAVKDMLYYGLFNEDGEDADLNYGQQLLKDYFIDYKHLSLEDPDHIYAMLTSLRQMIWHYTDVEAEEFKHTHMKFFLMLDYLSSYEQDVGSISFYQFYGDTEAFIYQNRLYLPQDYQFSIPLDKDANGVLSINSLEKYVDDIVTFDAILYPDQDMIVEDLSDPDFKQVTLDLGFTK